MENFYPKKIRLHPLIVIGGAALGLYFAIQQGIVDIGIIKRNWRKL